MSTTHRAGRALLAALLLVLATMLMTAVSGVVTPQPALAQDDDDDDADDADDRNDDDADDADDRDDDADDADDRDDADDADDRDDDRDADDRDDTGAAGSVDDRDDGDRRSPVGGVQTGAGGTADGGATPWLVGGAALLTGGTLLASRLRSTSGDAGA